MSFTQQNKTFALIDCNNFYASCERLFRPDLIGKPIVVLSNNDGCVIARSNEAKDLGIPMGEPYFKIKERSKKYKIHIFSSNYVLYGDLSERVMAVIEDSWPEVEVYSIDEAFLDLSLMPKERHDEFCLDLQKLIFKWTGIPTSIGIGPTKTLAKIANHICKKKLKVPVYNVCGHLSWLAKIDIGDVWGIGRQWQKKLIAENILTAEDLAHTNHLDMKKRYNVVMMKTILELQGIPCAGLEVAEPKQNIMASRSFGKMQTTFSALAEAISHHVARACQKARAQRSVAQSVHVFIRSNRFREDLTQYYSGMSCNLVIPTDDTRVITHVAKKCLKKLFKEGIQYKKVGIMLENLIDQEHFQLDLFDQPQDEDKKKQTQLMSVLDDVNARFGKHTLRLAAEGYAKSWQMRAEMRSPCFTTRWSDFPIIKI